MRDGLVGGAEQVALLWRVGIGRRGDFKRVYEGQRELIVLLLLIAKCEMTVVFDPFKLACDRCYAILHRHGRVFGMGYGKKEPEWRDTRLETAQVRGRDVMAANGHADEGPLLMLCLVMGR